LVPPAGPTAFTIIVTFYNLFQDVFHVIHTMFALCSVFSRLYAVSSGKTKPARSRVVGSVSLFYQTLFLLSSMLQAYGVPLLHHIEK